MGGAEIKEIGIKSGTVTVNVLSTLPNGKMIYNIDMIFLSLCPLKDMVNCFI